MISSVILLLVFSVLSCKGFNSEDFLKRNCQQTEFKYFDDQTNINIDLFCQNFNFTFEEIQDIQNRDFIISNKTTIYIENANIGTLNERFFRKFPNALEMILRDVEMIMESTETDSAIHSKLKTLRLLHCRLHEKSGTTAFNSLQSLEMIEIRSTTFERKGIDESLFAGCSKLKKVSITNSEINSIGNNVFRKLPLLRYLDLSYLGLRGESLSAYALVSNNHLEYLDLSDNELEDILVLPGSLKFLNASSNTISKISKSDLQNLPLLEELSLDDNNLENIPEDTFEGLRKLETVSLARNQIRSISDDTFKDLPKLESLYLQWNSIEQLPSGLDGIKNLIFEPQRSRDTTTTTTEETSSSTDIPPTTPETSTTTTTTEETSSSTTPETSNTTTTTSTSTTAPETTTLKPAVGGAQAITAVNSLIISLFISLFLYLY